MNRQGFLKLRNGLVEHVNGHQFTVSDLGVYTFLHLNKNWRTGICWTNAKGVATTLDDSPHSSIKDSFRRLREKKYIQYRQGDGSRSNYAVLLIEDEPTDGVLKGCRLKGFADDKLDKVVYDISTADRPDTVLRASACRLEFGWLSSGDRLVTVPLQDLQDFKTYKTLQEEQDLPDGEDVPPAAATPPPRSEARLQAKKAGKAPEVEDQDSESEPQLETPNSGSDPEALKLAQDFWLWLPDSPAYCKAWTTRWASQIKSKPEAVAYVRRVLHYATTQNQFFITGLKGCLRREEDPLSYLLDDKYQNVLSAMEVDESKKQQAKKSGSNKAPNPGGFEYREKQREI
jgi:hypothetical protein